MEDIERNNLDAHVSLCELRYQSFERRMVAVEERLDQLQILVLDIRDRLAELAREQDQRRADQWNQFQWWLVAVLLGVSAWALPRLLA